MSLDRKMFVHFQTWGRWNDWRKRGWARRAIQVPLRRRGGGDDVGAGSNMWPSYGKDVPE